MLGLLTSPLHMIFSLLVMQGISLAMFRSFVNQAITRVDPLKFSFNLGNTNTSTPSLLTSLLPSSSPVPTPAPIVDPRMLDLVQLIRAITPTNPAQANNNPAPATAQLAPIMSAPILAVPSTATVAHTSPSQQTIPQIIILPQYSGIRSASSDKVETVVEASQADPRPEKPMAAKRTSQVKGGLKEGESPSTRVNKPRPAPSTASPQKRKPKSKSRQKTAKSNLVVFEAVGLEIDPTDKPEE